MPGPKMDDALAQKLIDLTFSITLTLHNNRKWAKGKTQEEIAAWVAEQLRGCGFDTTPVGSSWGSLTREAA